MSKYELEKLVKSLSAAEKKKFRLSCLRYKGSKDYLELFDLLSNENTTESTSAEDTFKIKFPAKSFENTAGYLFRVLTDMLVQTRIEQDKWFAKHAGLMKARLCFERSLTDKGLKEIKKVQKIAIETQDHLMYYLSSRMELSHISDTGFIDLNEQELVDKQMKAKNTLQTLRKIHEHYSLFELLSFRLTHPTSNFKGDSTSKLNDLILSELSLITRGSQHQFESKKLHLLFQSFYFMHTNENRSALKIFRELNELIESNEALWDYPPYDYLSALDGILDNLRNIRQYEEMEYFIEKIESLLSRQYPEHFNAIAIQSIYLYRLNTLVGKQDNQSATAFFETIKKILPKKDKISNHEKYTELLFFAALAFFNIGEWQKANRYINDAIDICKNNQGHDVFRACRLLHIIIHVELDNTDYLNYEIRAYKRTFRKQGKAFLTEKLIFNLITFDPKRSSVVRKKLAWKKVKPQLEIASTNKEEQPLLKYFNFCEWIRNSYQD